MLKKIIAAVLIVLSAGTWGYLDYLNKQELQAAAELRASMIQAREQALARAKAAQEEKAKFEAQILADLNTCKADAEKTKTEFETKNQQPVRHKPGQFTIPKTIAEEAAKTLAETNAACQATYVGKLSNGK